MEKSFPFTFTNVACIAPTLTGSVATGTCEADSPWILFDVELNDPDKQSTGNTASLVLTDGKNTETIKLGELKNGALDGKVLWPGASVDADGKANGWPGWAYADGKWIQVDDNFAWTRGAITAKLVVNPELPVTISYPKATPECATGPKTTPGGSPASSNGTGLASTGFAGTPIAIVAGIIVIAGLAFLVVARIRRKRA
ncbi:cell wall protein [Agromyces sp. Root81]|nr:cell wall protein [Agromyces sp. Root81]